MKTFLLRFFTWWNGQTFGTQLWTWRYGELVGEDEFGNRYYRTKGGKIDRTLGFERRWVIYNGVAEASTVPPTWHGWLHHTVDVPPDPGEGRAAAVVEAASTESHRHRRRPSPHRIDPGPGSPAEGDRRLQGLAAGSMISCRPPKSPNGFSLLGFPRESRAIRWSVMRASLLRIRRIPHVHCSGLAGSPLFETSTSRNGTIAPHRLPHGRIGCARGHSGVGAVQPVRGVVRNSAAPPRLGARRSPAGLPAVSQSALSRRSLSASRIIPARRRGKVIPAFSRNRCLRLPEEPRRSSTRVRRCRVSVSRAARRCRPTPRRSRGTR